MKTSVLRRLRLAHGVSLRELATAAGVSHQFISELELVPKARTEETRELICAAFEDIIAKRTEQTAALQRDLLRLKPCLLDLGFALIGISDDSLSRYLKAWWGWRKNKRVLTYRGECNQHEFERIYLRAT